MVKKYDKQYQDYQSEVQSYLKKVKDGRRVPAADPQAPQFSQAADDERQARRAGLGAFIREGPQASRGGAAPAPFETPLSPEQERQFPGWKQQYAPRDSGADYDLRGAFKSGMRPDAQNGHWPDTYKKPNHPTFSDQSIYSSLTGTKPGTWQGDTYKPYPGGTSTPSRVWGFHEPTVDMGAGVEQGLSHAGKVLADPRNAWMGVAPLGVASRMGSFFRRTPRYPELGGFKPMNPGNMDETIGVHNYVRTFDPQNPEHIQSAERLAAASPALSEKVGRTAMGQVELGDEVANTLRPNAGGGVVPPEMRRRYGFR